MNQFSIAAWTFCSSLWVSIKQQYGNAAVFSSLSGSLYKKPLSLFVLPLSVPGCIFIYACPQELSQCGFLQACIWVAVWPNCLSASLHAHDCVCVLYINVNVCESCCTAWGLVPTKLFAFDAPSCGLQAASLMDNPLLPALLFLLKMKWVDEC